ncbi:amidohydrolase family protein [Gordonia sp. CPCC 205515]|uniref:amidohydrolase family protein n=1 Tax=Gordonia sp. CPCC 205515 TaxID=3140791 RepID=UPI003AF3FD34
MPDRVVDAHMRFWDMTNGWNPGLPDYAESVGTPELLQTCGPAEYRRDAGDFPVDKLVHISSALSPRSYLDELPWAAQLAERQFEMRYIGSVDPKMSDAEIVGDLDAQLAMNPHFAGIHVVYDFAPDSAAAATTMNWLNEHDLILELVTDPYEIPDWIQALKQFPDLTVALEHTGFPSSTDDDAHADWLSAITKLAQDTAVHCKVSGLSMTTHTFEPAALARWIEPAIETFGWDRVMFGSNFPVNRIAGTYQELQQSFDAVLGNESAEDQDRFYATNAIKLYGFDD